MYRCNYCGETTEDLDHKEVDMESYYGVGGMFPNHHYINVSICPYCGSEEIEDWSDEWDD